MIVVVTGSRNWTDYQTIYDSLAKLPEGSIVIAGGARGADTLAQTAALKLKLDRVTVKANWRNYGKAAGFKRNREMLDLKPDLVLGFRRSMSGGTTDCIDEAKRRGIPTEVIDID